jgi:putative IMPACT (imprinted ancient) family translation regulator
MGEIAYLAREADKTAKVMVRNDYVLVNDVAIADDLTPPNAEAVLMRSHEDEEDMENVYIYSTQPICESESRFQLFAAKVTSMEAANQAYKAIQRFRQAASSSHLISAHRLNNGKVGWRDDGDHAMGRKLYTTMKRKKMSNMVLFLARNFGGHHLGNRRFEIVESLVEEVAQVIQREDRAAQEQAERHERGEDLEENQVDDESDITTPDDYAWDANAAVACARHANYSQNESYFDKNLISCSVANIIAEEQSEQEGEDMDQRNSQNGLMDKESTGSNSQSANGQDSQIVT